MSEQPSSFPFAKGTRVRKVCTGAGDLHDDGTEGVVLAHSGPSAWSDNLLYGYWVQWDGESEPCFVSGHKLARVRGT
jgi:hypothetical protein